MIRQGGSNAKHVVIDIPSSPNLKHKKPNRSGTFDGERLFMVLVLVVVVVWLLGYLMFVRHQENPTGRHKPPKQPDTPTPPPTTGNLNVPGVDTEAPMGVTDTGLGVDEQDTGKGEPSGPIGPLDPSLREYTGVDPETAQQLNSRREAVKQAFLHHWNGYVKHAWGYDELKPVSKQGGGGWGGLGATIVDSIDTMMIMGLTEQIEKARTWIEALNFNVNYDASTFETTIRYLGGLLAAYDLSKDELYLDKAKDLADRLLPAFNSKSGIPYSTVNLKTKTATSPTWAGGSSFLAEFGSIQLEFRYLSAVTGNPVYADKVNKITSVMANADVSNWNGLYPSMYHPDRNMFTSSHLTFGARGDSFYEILLKQYIQSGRTEKMPWDIYTKAMKGMIQKLIQRTQDNLTYIDEMENGQYKNKMDHLACFSAGMLALDDIETHLELGKELMYTCWQFYERNPSGLGPEIASLSTHRAGFTNQASHYLLRPETVESLFVLYRVTGDIQYQDWGWKIFQALEKNCKTEVGYSGVQNVGVAQVSWDDKAESFFLAETLKYLYLLFSPKALIPLDEFVFNTEAHPTSIFPKLQKPKPANK